VADGSGLKLKPGAAAAWGPRFDVGEGSALPTSYALDSTYARTSAASSDEWMPVARGQLGSGAAVVRDAVYRPDDGGRYLATANGGGYQYRPRGSGDSSALRQVDGYLDRLSRWSKEDVGPAFDYAILDAASQGRDGLGRFLTGLRVVATASADAVSGTAGLGRLFTSQDVRDTVVGNAKAFLADPGGSISRAYDAWTSKAWHEQLGDVYKVFQSGAAGIGLAGKARSVFSVGLVDDLGSLGAGTQRVLGAYQDAYNSAAAAFKRDLDAGAISAPNGLNFNTWAGNRIDDFARMDMKAWKIAEGMDDLRVNQRLSSNAGIKDYRVPDLFLPGERTVIDGTIGIKGLTTPQIQDFFNSGKVDRVILVSPNQRPIIITVEQFRAGKG
jgi:hypothetical protein